MKKQITMVVLTLLLSYKYQASAQVVRTRTTTETKVTQAGIELGKDIWLEEGKAYDLKYNKDRIFSTTIKVLELDPINNLPRFYASLQGGIITTSVLGVSNKRTVAALTEVLGKFKYFTNNNKIRYDFTAAYGLPANSSNEDIAQDISRLRGSIGVQYVPFRFLGKQILGTSPQFSAGFAIDPVTNKPYPIEILSKYKIVREVGFRAGGLYNGVLYNIVNNDASFASSVNNFGVYAGISYGTVRNAIIGSTNIGMHKNSKFNEIYFDILYAPTNFTTNLINVEKPTNFSDIGYRFMLNLSKVRYHQHLSLQTSIEIAKYPGTNASSIGLHLGISFAPRTKYNADSIASDLKTTYEVTRKEGNSEVDSMLSGKKQQYDFITKNKKGYYILREYDQLYAKKPIKMVTTSREFIVTTRSTTQGYDSKGRAVFNAPENLRKTSTHKRTVNYYYANFDGTQQVVAFEDFASPKSYKKSLLYNFLKESPAANDYYLETIKKHRTIRRTISFTTLGLAATSVALLLQGNNQEVASGLSIAATVVAVSGLFINKDMDKKHFTIALNLYNKDMKKKGR